MKKSAKVVSIIVAVSIMICATTVSSSAFCLTDLFGCGQNGNCNSIVTLIQCLQNGKCNIFDLFTNKSEYINTSPENGCTGDGCNQNPAQTETVKPVTPASDVQGVFDLVNKERKAAGLSTLTLSTELCKVADIRAKEITKSFSHTRPNGTSCFTAFKENGVAYRYAGENIAYGQKTAEIVMNGWMNSSGHRANILSRNFSKIGISCYIVNGVRYWVQLFTD